MTQTALDIWKWTLTKEAIAPCFVRDVHAMRECVDKEVDFFWLGYTPCRSVLLVGMVVAIQVYDKRTIYTIDDGTSVIDCILRHPTPPKPKDPSPSTTATSSTTKKTQRSPPKKARLDKDVKAPNTESMEPPPPITETGYPVRVVGKVVRHYESRQIHADTIDPCPSSLDEIDHLKRVIELHKTKYSLAIPFIVPPPQPTTSSSTSLPAPSTLQADASIFTSDISSRPGPRTVTKANVTTNSISTSTTTKYSLPAPRVPLRNRPAPIPTHNASVNHAGGHVPSSPTASSIASSTPSSPCKTSSPVKAPGLGEPPPKPKLRHPSRLHTRDLSANTFRLYVKHYMDNAPPPFPWCVENARGVSTSESVRTPTKRSRRAEDDSDSDDKDEDDEERTPRPQSKTNNGETSRGTSDGEVPRLGFTLSHLRRVPELALLASRVVRAETRRREKVERERARERRGVEGGVSQGKSQSKSTSRPPASRSIAGASTFTSTSVAGASTSTFIAGTSTSTATTPDPARKKMKRLFSWAVVKLYEEGSIVLWDGDVRPLPVPPPPAPLPSMGGCGDRNGSTSASASASASGIWGSTAGTCRSALGLGLGVGAAPASAMGTFGVSSTSLLYASSASASLYSHYHSPRRPSGSVRDKSSTSHRGHNHDHSGGERTDANTTHAHRTDDADADADPANLSDPPMDEESYVPLTPRLLAPYVRKALGVLRDGRAMERVMAKANGESRQRTTGKGEPRVTGKGEPRVTGKGEPRAEEIVSCLRRMDGRWARVGVWAVEEALEVLKEG